MKTSRVGALVLTAAALAVVGCGPRELRDAKAGAPGSQRLGQLEALQRDYVDLRFGMFIHFGILTYTGAWSQPNLPIAQFNPQKLDARQWAAAAASAHMSYGVLTTRHHDGFALWPSAASQFNVKHIPWKNGQGDVVRAFVDAFRERGLKPGLYYSVWDTTQGVGQGAVTAEHIAYVKTQLTELLTQYGPIPILIFDGWSWKMGHQAIAYQEIRTLVKSLQPDCLMLDHSHLMGPWDTDIVNFEEPKDAKLAFSPVDNAFAANQGQKINQSGGNDWFWAPSLANLMSVEDIVDRHLSLLEPRWTNFLLNCPPNRDGLLDDAIVSRLTQVGARWRPNPGRAALPPQGPQNENPYTPLSVSATSGRAANAVDGINDWSNYTVWESSEPLPQSVTLDLGEAKPDVGYLGYVPRYVADKGPSSEGAITSYRVLLSVDGSQFVEAVSGSFAPDGKVKAISFAPTRARYVRFEALAAVGSRAAATEVTVGANR